LLWETQGDTFELAVEVAIPPEKKERIETSVADVCRYEIAVSVSGPPRVVAENLWLKPMDPHRPESPQPLFPQSSPTPKTIIHGRPRSPAGWRRVIGRGDQPEKVYFKAETSGWNNPFRVAVDRAALSSLPEDEERFPVATWFRAVLQEGVRRIMLSSEAMRSPAPPSRARGYLSDGSNLPWLIFSLERQHRERLDEWIAHVREALPDVAHIATREKEEDRSRYLVVQYRSGLLLPSWLVSDGTLRFLALTLLAYLPELSGVFLIEEPENGIHPRAVENLYQSLSSVYGAQILLATHSPVLLAMSKKSEILCFARDAEGATAIVSGEEHPQLAEWKGKLDLGTLFASGLLG